MLGEEGAMGCGILFLWVAAQSFQVAFGLRSFALRHEAPLLCQIPLVLSAVGSVVPVATLLLFIRVFVIGGSSNVAQFAGADPHNLWGLWFRAWPLMYFGNPPSVVVCLVAVALPPYPPRGQWSFLS